MRLLDHCLRLLIGLLEQERRQLLNTRQLQWEIVCVQGVGMTSIRYLSESDLFMGSLANLHVLESAMRVEPSIAIML